MSAALIDLAWAWLRRAAGTPTYPPRTPESASTSISASDLAVPRLHQRCGDCRHRKSDRQPLERDIPGLSSFGSAFGSSLGDSRLCLRHDRLTSVNDACGQFASIRAG